MRMGNIKDEAGQLAAPTPEQLLGQRVRHLRNVRGWSQTDLANELGARGFTMHQTTLAKLEGASRPTRLNEVAALAAAFEVELVDLVQPIPDDEAKSAVMREFQEAQDRVVVAQAAFHDLIARSEDLHLKLADARTEIAAAREHFEECRSRYESVFGGQEMSVAELNQAMHKRSKHLAERTSQQGDEVVPVDQQIDAIWKREGVSNEEMERIRSSASVAAEALKRAEIAARQWAERQGVKDAE